jgi:hypothetical protein
MWAQVGNLNDQLRTLLADYPGFIEIHFPEADPSSLFTSDETAISPWGRRHFSLDGYRMMGDRIAQRILADDRVAGSSN